MFDTLTEKASTFVRNFDSRLWDSALTKIGKRQDLFLCNGVVRWPLSTTTFCACCWQQRLSSINTCAVSGAMAMAGGFDLGAVGKFIEVVIGQAIREVEKHQRQQLSPNKLQKQHNVVTWGSYNGGVSSSLSARSFQTVESG